MHFSARWCPEASSPHAGVHWDGGQTDGNTCQEAFLRSRRQSSFRLSHRHYSLGGFVLGYPPILLPRAGISLKTGLFYYTPGTSTVPGTWQAQCTVTDGMASFEQLRGAADAVSTLVSKAEEGTASQASVPFLSRSSLSGSLALVKIGCSHKIPLLPPPSHLCTFPGRGAIQDERIEVKTLFHLSAACIC